MDKTINDTRNICQRCGKEYERKRKWQVFCGKECREKLWNEARNRAKQEILKSRQEDRT